VDLTFKDFFRFNQQANKQKIRKKTEYRLECSTVDHLQMSLLLPSITFKHLR